MTEKTPTTERQRTFTSARMEAVWEVAKREGFNNLKDFWEHIQTQGWTFYDVLNIISP